MPTIQVYKSSDDIDQRLSDYIEFLQDRLKEVPEEFRELATIKIEGYEQYGSGYVSMSIEYTRPESKEEIQARQDKAKQAEVNRIKADLRQLQNLKEAYEESGIYFSEYKE